MSEYDDQLRQMEEWANEPASKAPTADQRTIEWLMERAGHATASMFAAVMDVTKKGTEGAKRRNYRTKLVVERIMGEPVSNYVNTAMEWGTQQESAARMAYEARTGAMIEEVGFIHHKGIKWVGGSPDGFVGKDGMIECKCPFEPAVHVTTILTKTCEHLPQIQGLLWITGRQWCDFVSYDPRMPEGLRLYVQRILRDDDYIAELSAAVLNFLAEVENEHKTLLTFAASNDQATARAVQHEVLPPSPHVPDAVAPNAAGRDYRLGATADAPPEPASAAPDTLTEMQVLTLENALDIGGSVTRAKFRGFMAKESWKEISDIPPERFAGALKWINAEIDRKVERERTA